MYEDLNQLANLKFNGEVEEISRQTREKVQEMQAEYAALTRSSGLRSGQHDASVGQAQIEGSEKMLRALSQIWIDLIKRRNGHISRPDVTFIMQKVDGYAGTQKGHLHAAFSNQRLGAVIPLLTEQAGMRMYAVAAGIRRDLEIMAREHEAFRSKVAEEKEPNMVRTPKKRFSPGRRVLVGNQSRPGTIVSVDDRPGDMGEFRHNVTIDKDGQTIAVLGCDLEAFPELDEDLRKAQPSTINLHIEGSTIANLNLGSQIGTINTALESISGKQGASEHELVIALKQLTEATVTDRVLLDAEKQEIVQALSTVAEQATRKPEERSKGTLRAVISWLPTTIAAGADLTTLWDKFGPIIKAYFGF